MVCIVHLSAPSWSRILTTYLHANFTATCKEDILNISTSHHTSLEVRHPPSNPKVSSSFGHPGKNRQLIFYTRMQCKVVGERRDIHTNIPI